MAETAKEQTPIEDLIRRLLQEPGNIGFTIGRRKPLPDGTTHQTIHIENLRSLEMHFAPEKHDHLAEARGLFYFAMTAGLIVALSAMGAGVALVALGATGATEVHAFGMNITSTSTGVVCIVFGAGCLLILALKAMAHIKEILRASRH